MHCGYRQKFPVQVQPYPVQYLLPHLSVSPAPGSYPALLHHPGMRSYYLFGDTVFVSLPEIQDRTQSAPVLHLCMWSDMSLFKISDSLLSRSSEPHLLQQNHDVRRYSIYPFPRHTCLLLWIHQGMEYASKQMRHLNNIIPTIPVGKRRPGIRFWKKHPKGM